MNFKAIATTAFAAAFLAGAPGALAGVQRGNLAGFVNVTAIDRDTVDTISIPFSTHDGIVEVRCSTGDYTWNGISQSAALRIVREWCW